MSVRLPPFNPTLATSGVINTLMGTNAGKLLVANHSGVSLLLTFPDGHQETAWALSARLFIINIPTPQIPWTQDAVIQLSTGYDRVDLQMYGIDEEIDETYPVALQSPAVVLPSSFFIQGSGLLSSTPTDIGNVAIGNWPFSNDAVSSGLGVAGTIYALVYAGLLTTLPRHSDGTTIEGGQVNATLCVKDTGGTVVSSGLGDTDFLVAEMADTGGGHLSTIPLSTPQPIAIGFVCSVGAGPPYKIVMQAVLNNVYGPSSIGIVGSVAFGLTALTLPGLI